MVTFADATTTMRERVDAQLSDVLPLAWPNVPFQPPEGQSWARIDILPGEASQKAYGGSREFRHPGVLKIALMFPMGIGDGEVWNKVDTVLDAFRGVSVEGVTFRSASPQVVGEMRGWWQVVVDCPFFFDDTN